MFAIPDNEPETKQIPVESIEITNGDSISGLVGGKAQLNAVALRRRLRANAFSDKKPPPLQRAVVIRQSTVTVVCTAVAVLVFLSAM